MVGRSRIGRRADHDGVAVARAFRRSLHSRYAKAAPHADPLAASVRQLRSKQLDSQGRESDRPQTHTCFLRSSMTKIMMMSILCKQYPHRMLLCRTSGCSFSH
eukprot:6210270-Pleurochrysis_carterae.AAC.7